MSLPLVPLLQTQLETTLRLLISVSQEMTPDEIMAVRIRLNEAALVMGDIIANQSNNTTNGEFNHSPADRTTTAQNTGTPNGNFGRNRRSSTRPSTSRNATDRLVARRSTRSATRTHNVLGGSLLPGNRVIPLIEVATESDEE